LSQETRAVLTVRLIPKQGAVPKAKTQEEQQKQQQQRSKLRDQCSVGLQSGHFALLSRQWGEAVQLFQGQRNKRKAAQAFAGAPVNGNFPH